MSSSAILKLLRHHATPAEGVTGDDALLARFRASRDEQAFGALVQRYGRLVWSVCQQMLNHETDAEDAYQATFLALIRSSHAIRGPLAPWLHRVAYRVSIKLRQRLSRQTQRDKLQARSEATVPVPDSAWDSMLTKVHQEIAQLPEKLRVPLVLCCMEGQGVTEAAQSVGLKLGTFSSRLTQAKQLLLYRLTRRGLSITAAGLSIITISQAAAISPAQYQLTLQLLQRGTVSPLITSLCHGVVVMYTKMQMAAAVAVLLGVAGATSWVVAGPQLTGNPTGGGSPSPIQSSIPAAGSAPSVNPVGSNGIVQRSGGMNPLMNFPQQMQWEYRFLQNAPRTEQEYRGVFQLMEQQGFEFCGTVQVKTTGDDGRTGVGGTGAAGGSPPGGGAGDGNPGGTGFGAPSAEKVLPMLVFKRPLLWNGGGMLGAGMAPNMLNAGGGGMMGGANPLPGMGLMGGQVGGMPGGPGMTGGLTGGSEVGTAPADPGASTEASAHEQLAGHWEATSDSPAFRSVQFTSNSQVIINGQMQHYYINTSKKPMQMNIVGNGTLLLCIYQINDGVLKLSFYGRSETDRPTGFKGAGKANPAQPVIEIEFRLVPAGGGGKGGGSGRP